MLEFAFMQFQPSAQGAAVEIIVVHEDLVEVDGKGAVVQILVRIAHGEIDDQGWHLLMVNLELVQPRDIEIEQPILRKVQIAKIVGNELFCGQIVSMSSHLRLKLVSEEEIEVAVLWENRRNSELILLKFFAKLFFKAAK